MKKQLLTIILLLTMWSVQAQNFSADNNGKTIYYNITSNVAPYTVEVTSNYSEYTGDIILPSTVTYSDNTYSVSSIGYGAFLYCYKLTSLTIPNSVTSIGNGAFSSCTSLTSITIPNSVTSIGYRAFYNCTSLTSITIPNSVTSIDGEAFSGCTSLTSIEIPSSVTNISGSTFYGCTSLTSITIPNSVTSIGSNAFHNTDWYNNQPDGMIIINNILYDFKGDCPSSVTIPNSVTSIGNDVFWACTGLTSITIPNSVTSIGDGAFYECTSLTSITIPNSVTSIGSYVFRGCTNLTSITIPNSVTSIGYTAFSNCTGLTSITIPNSVTSIGGSAFEGCKRLTSIEIPNSVTSIGDDAFSDCTSLSSIEIPNSVTSIGENAFYYCRSLTSITIPNSVTSIGYGVFFNCTELMQINSLAKIPPLIDIHTFIGFNKTLPLYVPEESVHLYKEALYWNEFTNIKGISKQISFMNTSNSTSVDIETTGSWAASSNKPWITITPASGIGNGTIVITVASNTSNFERTGIVTINSTADVLLKGETTRTIVITQAAQSTTAIDEVATTNNIVQVVNGELQIINPNNEPVTIYTLQGKKVLNYSKLASGVYVVRVGNKSVKVVL